MSDNTIPFPTDARQTERLVKAFRTSFAEGMAGAGMSGDRIRRALDALEPDIRMLGESLSVSPLPGAVGEYHKLVLT